MHGFATSMFLTLVLGATALAATLSEVTADANALLLVFEDLEHRIDACAGGTCQEAQQILSDLLAAEGDRSQLHVDRATLDPCPTCSSVDATIDDLNDLSGQLASATGNWEEQG